MGREPRILRFRDGELVLDRPVVMGIVNVTPDSFSDGGKFVEPAKAVAHATRLADNGAEILDVGGESTRPGAVPVRASEEWRRLEPVLRSLPPKIDARIAVDTYKPEIAAKAISLGADLVNDVTGLRDERMVALVARERAAVVVMHMKGEPRTMQRNPSYHDAVTEVIEFLRERTQAAVGSGVHGDSIVVDPGLGFGKAPEHNSDILRRLSELRRLGFPVLVGPSRKWFLGPSGSGTARGRIEGGVETALEAVRNGADIVRVHDVAATAKALGNVRRPSP